MPRKKARTELKKEDKKLCHNKRKREQEQERATRHRAKTKLLMILQFIFDESSIMEQKNNQTYTTIKHKFRKHTSLIILKLNYQ